jgi:PleD family two-component response regulator
MPWALTLLGAKLDATALFLATRRDQAVRSAADDPPEVQEGSPERRARLVIADDHEATRVLLRTLVSLHPEIEVVGEADNGEEAARLAVSGEADIALLDIEMPRMDGLTAGTGSLRARRAKR